MAPDRLNIRLGDVMLRDPMPLHFYGVSDGSLLNVLRPYVSVTIENNYGSSLYWRLNRERHYPRGENQTGTIYISNDIRCQLSM